MKERIINKDLKEINKDNCNAYGCKNKATSVFESKLLCDDHYREKKPPKERTAFRLPPIPFYNKNSKSKA